MKSLQQFHNDKETEENVKNYLIQFLEEEAIKKMYARKDVSGIADAKEVIEKAFYNLEVLFDQRPKKKKPINEAR